VLHDVLPSGNSNGMNKELWIGRDRFGIEADDVRFLPYWDKSSGLESPTKDVRLAGWLKADGKGANKLLIAVVNSGEKAEAEVTIDPAKLGLPPPAAWKVWDAETQAELPAAGARFRIPVERHDYRQIIVQAR